MKTTPGFELRTAADALHTNAAQLRKRLLQLGAIQKTDLGYVAAPAYHRQGLLATQSRQHQLITEAGQSIRKHYTVVLVTGDGMAWLQNELQPSH